MNPSEITITNACIDALRLMGAVAWRVNSGTIVVKAGSGRRAIHLAPPGTADICACLPGGRFLSVETKRSPKEKLKDLQQRFLDRIQEAGGLAIRADSVDDMIAQLQALGVEAARRLKIPPCASSRTSSASSKRRATT